MLETVLPLIYFMKQEKSAGRDYELGGIHPDFYFHCFMKYDTVTERNGFTRSIRISVPWVGLLSLRLPSTVVISTVISTILPELDCRCVLTKCKLYYELIRYINRRFVLYC